MREKLKRNKDELTFDMEKIIKLVPLEKTVEEMATETRLTVGTVKANLSEMYYLFDVKGQVGLTRVAIQLNYFTEKRIWRRS